MYTRIRVRIAYIYMYVGAYCGRAVLAKMLRWILGTVLTRTDKMEVPVTG